MAQRAALGAPRLTLGPQAPGHFPLAMLERLSRLRSRRRSSSARVSDATAVRRACSAASRARSGPGGAARALSARPAASASGWQNIVVGTPARWAATFIGVKAGVREKVDYAAASHLELELWRAPTALRPGVTHDLVRYTMSMSMSHVHVMPMSCCGALWNVL